MINPEEDENSESDSEKEDDVIKPDDNLILVGHVEGDASVLEVYGKLTFCVAKDWQYLST